MRHGRFTFVERRPHDWRASRQLWIGRTVRLAFWCGGIYGLLYAMRVLRSLAY